MERPQLTSPYPSTGNWRKPKSRSLEDFVMWLFKVLLWAAVVYMTWRYALIADPTAPPWESLPILNRL